MAEIYTFTPKQKSTEESVELNRLRAKLLELHEIRDTLNKEIRYTKDAINPSHRIVNTQRVLCIRVSDIRLNMIIRYLLC